MKKEKPLKEQIQHNLLLWFDINKRDLPWRQTKDPYKIWVSEIMLQQTRVDTVVAYYSRFIERFPTAQDLAVADEQEVLRYWQGLGYYSRARNLHKGAKLVWEQYQGIFPKEIDKVKKIPGIGPYTAGAIMSIAFNYPYSAVDGNVMRVFSRILALSEDISKLQTVKKIQGEVQEYMPKEKAGDFTEALMELGALICTPKAPLCLVCPLFNHCEARNQGIQEELPVKSKKNKPKPIYIVFCVIRHVDKILIVQNTSEKLLKGMWGFPGKEGEKDRDEHVVNEILQELQIKACGIENLGTARHIFTHMDWDMHIYGCHIKDYKSIKRPHEWIGKQDISAYPFPKVYQKILNKINW